MYVTNNNLNTYFCILKVNPILISGYCQSLPYRDTNISTCGLNNMPMFSYLCSQNLTFITLFIILYTLPLKWYSLFIMVIWVECSVWKAGLVLLIIIWKLLNLHDASYLTELWLNCSRFCLTLVSHRNSLWFLICDTKTSINYIGVHDKSNFLDTIPSSFLRCKKKKEKTPMCLIKLLLEALRETHFKE